MIPNIFISSTIEDLHHLRDTVRETILEIGYNPVLSDYGDIGYSTLSSAEESCYSTIKDCQLVVLLIGKRYGSKSKNGLSITHNEFVNARDQNIPVISIVDKEVMTFKKVYDANKTKAIKGHTFPAMDDADLTFEFIQTIMDSPINNGILTFYKASEAREHLKKQLAHIFGNLLLRQFDPIKLQVQDVLSEIKTLRYELLKDKGPEPIQYLKATRFLYQQNERQKNYYGLIKKLDDIDVVIPKLLKCKSFDEFMENIGVKIEIKEKLLSDNQVMSDKFKSITIALIPENRDIKERDTAQWGVLKDGKSIEMNKIAKDYFDSVHEEFVRETTV